MRPPSIALTDGSMTPLSLHSRLFPLRAAAFISIVVALGCEDAPGRETAREDSTSAVVGAAQPPEDTVGRSVPELPPDTVPASFDQDAAFQPDGRGGMISTTVMALHFTHEATQPQKQAAVDLVGGRVVGGVRVGSGGLYYVQIDGDGTVATIDSVAAVLLALPQVSSAYAERVIPLGTGADSLK